MNLFSNYIRNNNAVSSLKDSVIFSLYHKNLKKNYYFKTNNSIKGFYKDAVLNDYVYFSSNGLKKNASIRKNEINRYVVDPLNTNFVSYFSNIEDNLLKFNIFFRKYFKEYNIKHNLQQRITEYLVNKKKFLLKRKIKTRFVRIIRTWNYPTEKSSLDYKNLIFLRNGYHKQLLLTDNGDIQTFPWEYIKKIIFTGLVRILPDDVQNFFRLELMLNYLIIKHSSDIILSTKKNINMYYNLFIYFLYLKFVNSNFIKHLRTNRLKIRRSNLLLYKYNWFYSRKRFLLLNMLNKLALTSLSKGLKFNLSWVNYSFLSKNNELAYLGNSDAENLFFLNRISNLTVDKKIALLKFLYFKLQVSLSSRNVFPLVNKLLKPFYIYSLLNSIIYKNYLTIYFSKFVNYAQKFLKFPIYSFINTKIVEKLNYWLSTENNFFSNRWLRVRPVLVDNSISVNKLFSHKFFYPIKLKKLTKAALRKQRIKARRRLGRYFSFILNNSRLFRSRFYKLLKWKQIVKSLKLKFKWKIIRAKKAKRRLQKKFFYKKKYTLR